MSTQTEAANFIAGVGAMASAVLIGRLVVNRRKPIKATSFNVAAIKQNFADYHSAVDREMERAAAFKASQSL